MILKRTVRRLFILADHTDGLPTVQGLATSPVDLFAGRRRRTHVTVQGRFRVPLSFDNVMTGQVNSQCCGNFGQPAPI